MNNFLTQSYIKTMIAVDKKGRCYSLDKIRVYNDQGVLFETNSGHFEMAKYGEHFEDEYIKNDITRKNKIDLSKKENFVISEGKNCFNETEYVLYIYYKNIDLQFVKISINRLLKATFKIFEKYETEIVFGDINRESDKIRYSVNDDIFKFGLTYMLFNHKDEFDSIIKELKNIYKKWEKQKEIEKTYTTKDYKKICFSEENAKQFENVLNQFNIECD